MANISRAHDAPAARTLEAEGVGLYRTEFELLAAGRVLSEDEQFERYVAVVEAMGGSPVFFRLLDLGGDKVAPFLGLPTEENPQLGLRGSRLLLARPELLRDQARALARASAYGPVHVMYPMVADVAQFQALRSAFVEAADGIETDSLQHGVMFEVPSACLQARELLEAGDFGSVGTNDLFQYLFAVDRDNDAVADDYDPDHPVLWAMLEGLARAATAAGRPLSVCGEIAGNGRYMPKLVAAGIDTVSVSTRLIPDVRRAAQHAGEAAASLESGV